MKRKCQLLNLNRSGLYYEKQEINLEDQDVQIMNEIRDLYLQYPFFGYRRMRIMLKRDGYDLNHKTVQRLMQKAGFRAIYPTRKTTIRDKSHAVYPYLLKKNQITRPNYAWQVDITYIRIKGGFVYLVALIDVFSRKIMGWSLSNCLDTESCLKALEMALKIAHPVILNSDQGCQFTSNAWCDILIQKNIAISMDGKGRWADNIYIERFWRAIKYEMVFLHRFETVLDTRKAIETYIAFYNDIRPHQALNYRTPNQVFKEFDHELKKEDNVEILPFIGVVKNSQILHHFVS